MGKVMHSVFGYHGDANFMDKNKESLPKACKVGLAFKCACLLTHILDFNDMTQTKQYIVTSEAQDTRKLF